MPDREIRNVIVKVHVESDVRELDKVDRRLDKLEEDAERRRLRASEKQARHLKQMEAMYVTSFKKRHGEVTDFTKRHHRLREVMEKRFYERLSKIDEDYNKSRLSNIEVIEAIEKVVGRDRRRRLEDDFNVEEKYDRKRRGRMRDLDGVAGRLNRTLAISRKVLSGFASVMAKISFVGLGGQLALFTAGLLTMKAALVSGRAVASAWSATLRGVAVVAASVTSAVLAAVSALRQYQEASLFPWGPVRPYTMISAETGNSYQQLHDSTQIVNRGLRSDVSGLLGAEATRSFTSSMLKAGVYDTGRMNLIGRNLFEMSAGSADTTAGLSAAIGRRDAAQFLSAAAGAEGVNQEALQALQGADFNQVLQAVQSGVLTDSRFTRVTEDLADTLVGFLRTQWAGARTLAANLGEPLIPGFQETLRKSLIYIRGDLLSTFDSIRKFSDDVLIKKIPEFVNVVGNWFRKLTNETLTGNFQGFEKLEAFWHRMIGWTRSFGDWMRSYEDAMDVVVDMFKSMADIGGGRNLFRTFSELLTDNKDEFVGFGQAIGSLFGSILDAFGVGQNALFKNMDRISAVFQSIGENLVPALVKMASALSPVLDILPNAIKGLANIIETLEPLIRALADVTGTVGKGISSVPGGNELLGAGLAGLWLSRSKSSVARMLNKGRQRVGGTGGLPVPGGGDNVGGLPPPVVHGRSHPATTGMAMAGVVPRHPYHPSPRQRTRHPYDHSTTAPRPPTQGQRWRDRLRLPGGSAGGRLGGVGATKIGGALAALSLAQGALSDISSGDIPGSSFIQQGIDSPLLGSLQAGLSVGMINPMAGLVVGGLSAAGFGAANAYQSGQSNVSNLLASAAGGAAAGGAVAGPVGAVVGAGLSVAGNYLASWAGRSQRGREARDLASAINTSGGVYTDYDIAKVYEEQRTLKEFSNFQVGLDRDDSELWDSPLAVQAAMAIDPKNAEMYAANQLDRKAFMRRTLGLTDSGDPDSDLPNKFRERISFLDWTIRNFTEGSDELARVLGTTTEEAANLAKALGITLIDGLSAVEIQIAQMARNQIDRTELVQLDFNETPLGQQRLEEQFETSMDNMLTDFYTTGEMSPALFEDMITAGTAYQLSVGTDPDVAQLSAYYSPMAHIRDNIYGGSEVAAMEDPLYHYMHDRTLDTVDAIATEHNMPNDILRAAYLSENVGGVEEVITQAQARRKIAEQGQTVGGAKDLLDVIGYTRSDEIEDVSYYVDTGVADSRRLRRLMAENQGISVTDEHLGQRADAIFDLGQQERERIVQGMILENIVGRLDDFSDFKDSEDAERFYDAATSFIEVDEMIAKNTEEMLTSSHLIEQELAGIHSLFEGGIDVRITNGKTTTIRDIIDSNNTDTDNDGTAQVIYVEGINN